MKDLGVKKLEKVRVKEIMEVREKERNMVDEIEGRERDLVKVKNGWEKRCNLWIIKYGRGN